METSLHKPWCKEDWNILMEAPSLTALSSKFFDSSLLRGCRKLLPYLEHDCNRSREMSFEDVDCVVMSIPTGATGAI